MHCPGYAIVLSLSKTRGCCISDLVFPLDCWISVYYKPLNGYFDKLWRPRWSAAETTFYQSMRCWLRYKQSQGTEETLIWKGLYNESSLEEFPSIRRVRCFIINMYSLYRGSYMSALFVCLFVRLILYIPSILFQLCRDWSSWVEPVLG